MAISIYDVAGPRRRRLIHIGSLASGVLLAGAAGWAVNRLNTQGQFDTVHWDWLADGRVARFLLIGLSGNVLAAVLAFVLSSVLGIGIALTRLYGSRTVRWIGAGVSDLCRSVPVLVPVLFFYLGFAEVPLLGQNLTPLWALVLGITVYHSAVMAEIFRAGIKSVGPEVWDATLSLGFTKPLAMIHVILPLAARRMTPVIVTQMVTLFKDTSYGYLIGFEELLRRGRINAEYDSRRLIASYVVVLLTFVLVNSALSGLASLFDQRVVGAGKVHASTEELAVVQARERASRAGKAGRDAGPAGRRPHRRASQP